MIIANYPVGPVRGLFIVHSDLSSLEAKGVMPMFLERGERGFLDRVVTLHPLSNAQQTIHLAPEQVIHELKVPKTRRFRPYSWLVLGLHLLKAVRFARRLVRFEELSFVRSQDPFFAGLIGYLATFGTSVPFCISVHADYDMQEKISAGTAAPRIFGSYNLSNRLQNFLLRRADLVLGISEYMCRYAERHGADPRKVRTFRHLIDIRSFEVPALSTVVERLDLPKDRRIIGVVSRLTEEKFIYDYVDLAQGLRARRNDFLIAIGGLGDQREPLEQKIKKLGLENVVRLLGPLSKDQVRALRQQSFINMALLDGASLIEACSAARPVIAYATEWHSELVEHNATGILVPERNIEALALAVESLLDDPLRAEKLGRAAKHKVDSIFGEEKVLWERRKIYRELVGLV
ncbi:MAG: glycosyltransferase [Hyphomicrobium sp.]|nr:glycosyltransferase [Hyphomicrobium sp.]